MYLAKQLDKIFLVGICILYTLTTTVNGQDNKGDSGFEFVQDVSSKGTTAAAFLEIGVGARAIGMGGAFVAQKGDVDMLYWNPAGIAFVDGISFIFNNAKWLAESNFNNVGVVMPVPAINGAIGFSFTSLGFGDQPVRTVEQPEGTGELYDALDYVIGASVASRLINTFSFGLTAKYINQRIWSETASAFAVDMGVFYQTPLKGFTLGTSISNFGTDLEMKGRNLRETIDPDPNNASFDRVPVTYVTKSFSLPLYFRFGMAYELDLGYENQITLAADLLHPNNTTESINLGVEYGFQNLIFFRAGYQNLFEKESINGLTFGAGINYILRNRTSFIANYSYSEWGVLKNVHRISFGAKF